MIICIMCHFFRSVSDGKFNYHGKCGIQLKLSTVRVYSCVVLVVSEVAMGNRSQELIKNRGKNVHFYNLCDT